MGARPVVGIASTISSAVAPRVGIGHVAGWVGVGGPKEGPGGTDEWVQVGLSSLPGGRVHLYYEQKAPGVGLRLVDLGASFDGAAPRVAVRQVPLRPSWWRVYVDGRPVAPPLRLVGSAAGLTPVATGESWQPLGAGTGCNTFAFRFRRVRIVDRGARSWVRFETGWKLENAPYAVERRADGFTALFLAAA